MIGDGGFFMAFFSRFNHDVVVKRRFHLIFYGL